MRLEQTLFGAKFENPILLAAGTCGFGEEIVNELKAVRNRKAGELGIERGSLMSNTVLLDIARSHPRTEGDLLAVDGVRHWQAEVLARELLAAL